MRLAFGFLLVLRISFGQTQSLQQYLNLTSPQAAAIKKLNADYQTYLNGEQTSIKTLDRELTGLYASPAPDPNQLGLVYAKLESIRRDIAQHLAVLQTQIAAQLDAAQSGAIKNLDAAAVLQPLISDAQCAFLIDPPYADPWFNTFQFATAGVLSGSSSIIYGTPPYIPPAPSGSFCGSTLFPTSIRQYLNLTDAEVSAIFGASAAYNDYYARKQNRIADLQVEIRDQTAKPSPDPMALGTRYAELAAIRVDLRTQGNQLRQIARSILTSQQTAQLNILQADVALQPLISEAQGSNFLVLTPGTEGGPGGYLSGSFILDPSTPVRSSLRQFLNLTGAQDAAINNLNSDYQKYFSSKQTRVTTVNSELADLYSHSAPDPNQLGMRYVELEGIRREVQDRLASLQVQASSQLNPFQSKLVETLRNAADLQPLISDAQCGFLVDPAPAGFSFASFSLTAPVTVTRSGAFSLLLGFVSPFVLPFIPPAPSASFCGSTVFPISVREYLNLTDSEISAIFSADAAYNDYYVRKQDRITDVNVEIRDETAKPSPDPGALGVRYAELQGIGQEIQQSSTDLRQTARGALTPQQSAQLKTLQENVPLQPVIAEAQACNLLVLPPGAASGGLILDPWLVRVSWAVS